MPFGGPYTQLPKELQQIPIAIPNSAMTAVTTTDTEVAQITIVNTTGGALTVTVQDTQATPKAYLSTQSIGANTELMLDYDPPVIFKGGFQWQASSTGLVGTVRGRSVMGLSLGTAAANTNNIRPPA